MKPIPSRLAGSILVMMFIMVTASVAGAQMEGVKNPVEHQNVLSTNPLGAVFTWFSGEFERKIAGPSSIGIGGSYLEIDDGDEQFISGQAFYRYYPQGAALVGFFFGGRFGVYDVKDTDGGIEEQDTFFGAGIDIGYSWLLGASRRFGVSLGIGAVRLFGGDLEDVALTLPTVRLVNIGVAF
jgi:hypothetical protein